MGNHGIGDLDEAGDVGAEDVVSGRTVLFGSPITEVVNVDHDLLKLGFGILEGPGITLGILLHLQGRGGNATGVGGLAGTVGNLGVKKDLDPFRRRRHVRPFADGDAAVLDEGGGILAVDFVLGGRRHGDLAGDLPDVAVFDVLGILVIGQVVLDAATLDLFELLDEVNIETFIVNDDTVGVGAGDAFAAELMDLFDGVDGDVAGAGDQAGLAAEGVFTDLEGFIDEEGGAVTGRLGAGEGAAPLEAFAGEDAGFPAVGDALVLAEHVADLAAADADVAGGDVGVLTDVAIKFGHEGLAEAHDFVVRLPFGVKVGAALAAADRQAGQGVLEDLLETEELDDAEIDRGVEAQAALVGAEGAVELDAETAVDMGIPFIVLPGNPEDDLALRLTEALDDLALQVLGVFDHDLAERFEDLAGRLMKLNLAGITFEDVLIDGFESAVELHAGLLFI